MDKFSALFETRVFELSLCNDPVVDTANPFRQLVGGSWDALASAVQAAHSPPINAKGRLDIWCATEGIAGSIAKRIKLPPAGKGVETTLEVRQIDSGVEWVRTFGTMRAVSVQRFRTYHFEEAAGPFRLLIRLVPEGDSLRHMQIGVRVFGIPVPAFLGPRVSGLVSPGESEDGWRVSVEIGHAWLGALCSYKGEMRRQ